jgi:uncharacterized protein YodC (DUF2158 family)
LTLLFLLAAAALFAMPAMASAATLYVDDEGSDTITAPDDNPCTDADQPCATIGHAIGVAPGPTGDEIQVGGGTYAESVTLANAELLNGEAFTTAAAVTTTGDVVIGGNPTVAACPNPTIAATSAATVEDLTIHSAGNCEDVSIASGSTDAVVRRNIFDDATKATDSTPNLVVLDGAGAPTIQGNTFTSGTSDQLAVAIHGASMPTIGGPAPADRNTFSGFATAIAVGLSGDAMSAQPTIEGNHITALHKYTVGIDGVGIDIGSQGNPIVRANLIDVPGTGPITGVRLSAGAIGAQLERNQILGMTTGLSTADAGPVTLSQDAIRSTDGNALIASDAGDDGGGDVAATNVDLFGSNAAAVQLADTHMTLTSSIVGDGGAISDGGIDAAGNASCTIANSRGPTSSAGCDDFDTSAVPAFDGTAGLEFKLTASNPALIDKGDPGATFGMTEPDLYGEDRILDGDCVVGAQIDIGVSEFRRTAVCPGPPPPPPAIVTSVRERNLYEFLAIKSKTTLGNYKLCVDGPGSQVCKTFRGDKADTVNWKAFPYRGAGRYRVRWFHGRKQLGDTRVFNWGPCAPANLTMRGVWRPSRLKIKNRCKDGYYTVTKAKHEFDGDIHVNVNPFGDGTPNIRNFEIIPRDHGRFSTPSRGTRLRLVGVYLCDSYHGHGEFHPVFEMDRLKGGSKEIASRRLSGPERGGTPTVHYTPKQIFHCR